MEIYDSIGGGYARHRQPDSRIAQSIRAAIGDVRTLVNVGAGAGSYEPNGVAVTAVEPAWRMLAQRKRGAAPALRAVAERLPFRDACFDVALGVLTAHHWRDLGAGLREMVRVARERVVIFTWDPEHPGFWLTRDYFPEILAWDRSAFPSIDRFKAHLADVRVEVVPVPAHCCDGFLGAYWKRPSAYLDAGVRQSISTFSRLATPALGLARLESDLQDGTWLEKNGAIVSCEEMDLGYRLIVARGNQRR